MVWIAWEPPPYTHSTSRSRWTRNQRATSMIFGRSTQNTWMKKTKPQKQSLTGLDFEINVKNCQKMSKNAKNRENWSFAMSCSSETSMVRSGFFYIISKIMHERTTTESLVTIARWFFPNYKVAFHLNQVPHAFHISLSDLIYHLFFCHSVCYSCLSALLFLMPSTLSCMLSGFPLCVLCFVMIKIIHQKRCPADHENKPFIRHVSRELFLARAGLPSLGTRRRMKAQCILVRKA